MLQLNFDPFPELTTERLILREVLHSDKEEIFAFRSDPETMRFVPRPVAQTVADVVPVIQMMRDYVDRKEKINWNIVDKDTGKVIGMIGYVNFYHEAYRAEVGYILNKNYHGKGIILEALKAVTDHGFNAWGLHSIEAIIHPDNIASCRVVEKYGFTRDAHFKDYKFYNGKFIDALVYSFIAPENKKG